MSRILLVSHADHDIQTQYLTSWFEKVLDAVKKQNDIRCIELTKEQSTKENFTKLIEQENPQFVVFNGHGSPDSIMGFEYQILIKADDNEKILSGKIVHSMACQCAKELGPKCIAVGGKCFIGYKEDYEIWYNKNLTDKKSQLKDPLAKIFLEPAYEVIIALIEGNTASEAIQRSQKMYNDNLLFLITGNPSPFITLVAGSLNNDRINQVCLGDQSAKFV